MKEAFRQPTIIGIRSPIGKGASVNSSGSRGSGRSSQLPTPCRGSNTNFTMVGEDPTIRLLEFHGEGSEDPKKHPFICENI